MTSENRYDRARRLGIQDRAVALPFDPRTTDDYAEQAERWLLEPYGLPVRGKTGPDPCDWVAPRLQVKQGREYPACGDVKWTPREDGGLLVGVDKMARHRCLVYALVVGLPDAFRLVGWAWGHILQAHPGGPGGGPPACYLGQGHLDLKAPESFPVLMAATFGLVRR